MIIRYTYVCEACHHGWTFELLWGGDPPTTEVLAKAPDFLSDVRARCNMCGNPGHIRGMHTVTPLPRGHHASHTLTDDPPEHGDTGPDDLG